MPTTRPRHPVTETDDIAGVLDRAARQWPGVPRSALIRLVLLDWVRGGHSDASRSDARDALVGSLPGSAGLYSRADEWPR